MLKATKSDSKWLSLNGKNEDLLVVIKICSFILFRMYWTLYCIGHSSLKSWLRLQGVTLSLTFASSSEVTKSGLSSGLLVDWLEHLDPEVTSVCPDLQQKLLFTLNKVR